jgi:hypothetical protein
LQRVGAEEKQCFGKEMRGTFLGSPLPFPPAVFHIEELLTEIRSVAPKALKQCIVMGQEATQKITNEKAGKLRVRFPEFSLSCSIPFDRWAVFLLAINTEFFQRNFPCIFFHFWTIIKPGNRNEQNLHILSQRVQCPDVHATR